MRIKNIKSNACNEAILCILAFFLVFLFIDLGILFIALNSGMTLIESFSWMYSSFCEADLEMKFIYIILLVFPFFWLAILIYELRIRAFDNKIAYNSEGFIEYVDFMNNSIKLSYNSTNFKEIYYNNIDSLELIIDTCIAYNKYGPYSAIQNLFIKISSGSYVCSINHAPVDLNKLYKIIFYSQYVKNFSYKFTGNGEQTKETLGKLIDDYIKNNYQKTFKNYLYSPITIVLASACVGSFIVILAFLFSFR